MLGSRHEGRLAGAVIPAAGLGTRLHPLTLRTPKELLPVGGEPAIAASLREAQHAGIRRVVVVTSPTKPTLAEWLAARTIARELEVVTVVQPEPLGVLDAVDRGRAELGAGPYAVLYPDYLQLPNRTGLRQLVEAHAELRTAIFGLLRVTEPCAGRMGRTAQVETLPLGGRRHRVTAIRGVLALEVGVLHSTFAEIRTETYEATLAAQTESGDAALLPALRALVAAGQLHGVELEGTILDVGVRAGYDHAVALLGA